MLQLTLRLTTACDGQYVLIDTTEQRDGSADRSTPSERTPMWKHVDVSNCTVDRISLRVKNGRVEIPPLGCVCLKRGEVRVADLLAGEAASRLKLRYVAPPPKPPTEIWTSLVFLAIAGIVAVTADAFIVPAVIGLLAMAFAGKAALRYRRRFADLRGAVLQVPSFVKEYGALAVVWLILLLVPGAILFVGSDVPELWHTAWSGTRAADGATVTLIGIGVQMLCIVGAAALPVLLYFLFDRERQQTLRAKFMRNAFRLDPSIHTLSDFDARYGKLLGEVYGRSAQNRFLPGSRAPIFLATAVITLGWTVALLDTHPTLQPGGTFTSLIEPTATAPTFAFLGAYFFTLNHVLRGYVRGDLRPKTYAQVATRIVCVAVLAFVLERLVAGFGGARSSAALLTIAFIAGVVPETILIRLQEIARGFAMTAEGRRRIGREARTYETEPLTRLQGIDIYDRARLLDEGVTNVEGLAHHDVTELLLKTRIPASRLIDWVDQAILFIHCSATPDGDGTARPTLDHLWAHGIRTATDLEQAHSAAERRGAGEKFLQIAPTRRGQTPVLRVVLDAIAQEDWMPPLRHWHRPMGEPPTHRVPEDFVPSR